MRCKDDLRPRDFSTIFNQHFLANGVIIDSRTRNIDSLNSPIRSVGQLWQWLRSEVTTNRDGATNRVGATPPQLFLGFAFKFQTRNVQPLLTTNPNELTKIFLQNTERDSFPYLFATMTAIVPYQTDQPQANDRIVYAFNKTREPFPLFNRFSLCWGSLLFAINSNLRANQTELYCAVNKTLTINDARLYNASQ